jgi:hypothetical protein
VKGSLSGSMRITWVGCTIGIDDSTPETKKPALGRVVHLDFKSDFQTTQGLIRSLVIPASCNNGSIAVRYGVSGWASVRNL